MDIEGKGGAWLEASSFAEYLRSKHLRSSQRHAPSKSLNQDEYPKDNDEDMPVQASASKTTQPLANPKQATSLPLSIPLRLRVKPSLPLILPLIPINASNPDTPLRMGRNSTQSAPMNLCLPHTLTPSKSMKMITPLTLRLRSPDATNTNTNNRNLITDVNTETAHNATGTSPDHERIRTPAGTGTWNFPSRTVNDAQATLVHRPTPVSRTIDTNLARRELRPRTLALRNAVRELRWSSARDERCVVDVSNAPSTVAADTDRVPRAYSWTSDPRTGQSTPLSSSPPSSPAVQSSHPSSASSSSSPSTPTPATSRKQSSYNQHIVPTRGDCLRVIWGDEDDGEGTEYGGRVRCRVGKKSFTFTIAYDDGEVHTHDLDDMRWRFDEPGSPWVDPGQLAEQVRTRTDTVFSKKRKRVIGFVETKHQRRVKRLTNRAAKERAKLRKLERAAE